MAKYSDSDGWGTTDIDPNYNKALPKARWYWDAEFARTPPTSGSPGVVSDGEWWYVWPDIGFDQMSKVKDCAHNGQYPTMEAAMAVAMLIYRPK